MYAEGKFDLEAENADENTAVSGYYFSGTTYDLNLESPFTVTVPLQVYGENGRCENQDLTFTVNLSSQAETLPDQEFTQDDFTVTLTGLKKTPVFFYGAITVKMTEVQYNSWQQTNSTGDAAALLLPRFTDPEGNICPMRSLTETSGSIETTETTEIKENKETRENEGVTEITETGETPDATDTSTASVLTDLPLTDGVYTATCPFLLTLPDQAATDLTLTLTTHDSAEADTPNPTVTLLGTPMRFSLES